MMASILISHILARKNKHEKIRVTSFVSPSVHHNSVNTNDWELIVQMFSFEMRLPCWSLEVERVGTNKGLHDFVFSTESSRFV